MINKEDLENFYTNHSTKETCIFFNVSKKELIEILDEYNIQPHTKQENISFTLLNKTEEQKNQILELYCHHDLPNNRCYIQKHLPELG